MRFEAAIRDVGVFIKRWPETVRSLITRYPVEKAPELLLGRAGGIKNVITFDTSVLQHLPRSVHHDQELD